MQGHSPDGGVDARAAARTNLFLAATLHLADGPHPVKIRDLSAAGAQIESSLPHPVGTGMTLARGHLSVQTRVTWRAGDRFGLQFASPIAVHEWMANPVSREQQRADPAVAAGNAGAVPPAVPADHQAATAARVAGDLKRVSQLLAMLGDGLASDPAVVTNHGVALQNLGIALRTLNALAETMHADASERTASAVRLAQLRIDCAQAVRAA